MWSRIAGIMATLLFRLYGDYVGFSVLADENVSWFVVVTVNILVSAEFSKAICIIKRLMK